MNARWMGRQRCGAAALIVGAALWLAAALAPGQSPSLDVRATESFRSAAALQNRGLYDLAAAEWAAMLESHPRDSRAAEAHFHRGVCLFQLGKYADAAGDFRRALTNEAALDVALREQAQTNLGLAYYNLGRISSDAERDQAFAAALAAFAAQLEQFPGGPLAPLSEFYRAEIAYARGDLPAAIDGYQALISQHSGHPLRATSLYALGVAQQEIGQAAEAVTTFRQFLDQYPHDSQAADARSRLVEALFAEAQAEERAGQLVAAHLSLIQLLSSAPHHELARPARLARANVRFEMHRYADALDDVKALLATRPPQSVRSDALLIRGMCQAARENHDDAIQTFNAILNEDPTYGSADRVLYELAWSYAASKQADRSMETFGRLTGEHADSPFVAECHFRIGEAQFAAGEFAAAARSFQMAQRLSKDAKLQEKSTHKWAWALFSQGQFADAARTFADQLAKFAAGPLSADARIMIAESRFALRDYSAAFDAYQTALADNAGSHEVRGVALLHAAQTANQLDKWAASLELLQRCEREFPDNPWTAEIRCERGWACYHQNQLDTAWQEFQFVAGTRTDVLAARARFMLGEIQFSRKQYDDAARTFFTVAYGYGGTEAPRAFHRWQAEAIFEAARCLEQTRRHDSARKLYRELLAYYPDSPKASLARVALDGMKTR